MRIGIDVRCFARGKNTGVEEYARNILSAIFEADENNEYILFFNAWKDVEVDFGWATKHSNVTLKIYKIPNKLLNFSLWLFQYPKLDKLCGGVDVFFMPNSNFCAISSNVRLFLTVHDLSFEHYKESFSLKRKLWHFFVNPRLLAKRADHLFAVSRATKADICVTYGISKNKISHTLNGATSIVGNYDRNNIDLIKVKEKYSLPYEFILYFGTIEPRKNIINLMKAYNFLRKTNKGLRHKLVIAGAHGWKGEKIKQAVEESDFSEDIIILVNIPEDEKEILYMLSSVFIYPSFFEGFGFPPLEAIACHVPVITSHTTSLPEVVNKNAIMIDPTRPDEILQALENLLLDKELQKLLKGGGHDHIRGFSWMHFTETFASTLNK